jgi:integrase
MREYLVAQVPSKPVGKASLDALITDYMRHEKFTNKKLSTQQFYRRYLEQLRSRFGDMPVEKITPGWIERLRLDLQDQPFKCNHTLAVLKIILKIGVKLDYCKANAAREVEKIRVSSRDQIWVPHEIRTFLDSTAGSLRLAMALMLGTAQRLSDVLAMTKGQVSERDGRLFIAVRQQKTGTLIDAPIPRDIVEPLLRARLADQDDSVLLVRSPHGLPWARRNFSRAWDAARKKAGLPPLQRRDLRRTAVVFMAATGLSDGQITAITGHRADTTRQILDTYLPRRPEIALAGMEKWEQQLLPTSIGNVITLGQKR